jgi:hypothetical protein
VKRSGRTIADLDKLVPFGRLGKPEEVAALVAFLSSDEAAFMCVALWSKSPVPSPSPDRLGTGSRHEHGRAKDPSSASNCRSP